jgi:YD repeat-containing protein
MRKSSLLVPIALLAFLAPFGDAGSTPQRVCYPPQLRPTCDGSNPICAPFVETAAEVCANHAAGLGAVCDGVTQQNRATGVYFYDMHISNPGGNTTPLNNNIPLVYCRTTDYPGGLIQNSARCFGDPNDPSVPNLPGFCEMTNVVSPDKNNGKPCPNCGNPINPLTGNKYQQELDYQGPGAFPLRFERHYNSAIARGALEVKANLGSSWNHTYARSISNGGAFPDMAASARREDGRVLYFLLVGSVWRADADVQAKLEKLVDGTGATTGWRYTTENEDVEIYDASGRLVSIANREGLTQTLTYDAQGRLFQVTDAWGEAKAEANTSKVLDIIQAQKFLHCRNTRKRDSHY